MADYLKDELAKRTSTTVTHWLQGSYKFRTQIRPASKGQQFDIDLGVYFDPGKWSEFKFSASELKEIVQESMVAYAADPQTDALSVDPPKKFCSRAIFSEDFHIDVPAYRDTKPELATQTKGFVESDPRALYDWWMSAFSSDAQRDRARRVVRYLKMWAALKYQNADETPSSILLTVAVARGFATINEASISGDDELFVTAVESTATYLVACGGAVKNPVNEQENLNRMGGAFGAFVGDLSTLVRLGRRALACGTQREAADTWTEGYETLLPTAS